MATTNWDFLFYLFIFTKLLVNHLDLFQTPGVYDNQLSLHLSYYHDTPLNFYESRQIPKL